MSIGVDRGAQSDDIRSAASIKKDDNLAHLIRIFTDPSAKCRDPAYRKIRPNTPLDPEVEAWTDGSCLHGGTENARTGSGVWYGEHDPRNASLRVPGKVQSNQVGELVAVLHTVQTTSPFAPLKVTTDSEYVINGLTKHLQDWEERGWIGVANSLLWRVLVADLRQRGAPFMIRWVKGHSGDIGNEGADRLAGEGALKNEFDDLKLVINAKFNLTGAQLSKMTQARAYQAIREKKVIVDTDRRGTAERLAMTKGAAGDNWGQEPDSATIYKALQHKDISRPIRTFLWKATHKAQKIGEHWERMGEKFTNWGECKVCEGKITECMQHILLECDAPDAKTVWALAEKLWQKKMKDGWPELRNIGSIIASTTPNFRTEEGKIMAGANRLYKILITESAHLIWKLRNKRIFRGPDDEEFSSSTETHNRWVRAINTRLELDIAMTNKKFERSGAIPRRRVLQTWRGVLKDEKSLPSDWIRSRGVLVDIERKERPAGRNQTVDTNEPP